MKYKVGDKVRVVKDLNSVDWDISPSIVEEMVEYSNQKLTISEIVSNCYYVEENEWTWADHMFEQNPFKIKL